MESQLQVVTAGAVDVIAEAELRAKLAGGRPLRVKLGIDPTASDIHLGFAVVLRRLRMFQDLGHIAVLIIGDFTAQLGDPSGKSATRPRLSKEQVDEYAQTYLEQVGSILDMSPERLEVRRNADWLAPIDMAGILALTSKVTVARMLERDDFSNRYRDGVPISLMEFLYPLLQATDSVEVEADVELGGTDQLFNLIMGRHLQGQAGQDPQVVLTTPLLVGLDGEKKMSKSLGNYVGIAEPPAEQFGKLMSIPDDVLPMYLRYATGWLPAQVDDVVGRLQSGDLHPNAAKRLLGRTVADLYHGPGAGEAAEAAFDRVFKRDSHEPPDRERMAHVPLTDGDFAPSGELALSRLLQIAGLAESRREAVRYITEGGVRIDGRPEREDRAIGPGELNGLDGIVLQVGRRKWAWVWHDSV